MGKADEDRARRLAEALRQNLRRRKARAREAAALPGDGADGDAGEAPKQDGAS